jgi:hypothetical protein
MKDEKRLTQWNALPQYLLTYSLTHPYDDKSSAWGAIAVSNYHSPLTTHLPPCLTGPPATSISPA